MILDVAGIVFICVTANHLGLVSAAEKVFGKSLPIANCVKCSTFWAVLIYMFITTYDIILSPATSFLASYVAIWLELFEGLVDKFYLKLYETLSTNYNYDTSATSADDDDSEDTMSKL